MADTASGSLEFKDYSLSPCSWVQLVLLTDRSIICGVGTACLSQLQIGHYTQGLWRFLGQIMHPRTRQLFVFLSTASLN